MTDCSKVRVLREELRRLSTENARSEELDRIGAQIADRRNFWHPIIARPVAPA
jgi:hypothetical protein